jgi:hypothetical protein
MMLSMIIGLMLQTKKKNTLITCFIEVFNLPLLNFN